MFPEFPTSRAAVRFGVFLQIFDIRKVALVKVKVEGTWIVAKRSMDQLSGNLWLGIIWFIVFIFFSIGFSGFEGIDKDIDFKEVF